MNTLQCLLAAQSALLAGGDYAKVEAVVYLQHALKLCRARRVDALKYRAQRAHIVQALTVLGA